MCNIIHHIYDIISYVINVIYKKHNVSYTRMISCMNSYMISESDINIVI